MFGVTYERKLNGNYLVLEEEHPTIEKNEFEIRMLRENNIPGFLRCTVRCIDGKEQFAYDITSRQSLKRLYEEQDIGYSDMKSILLGMMKGFEAVSEYFLNEKNLVLLPEYIYADIETKQAFLCFYPFYHVNIHQSFQGFAEYLLQKTDHMDEKAVVLAYAFYKQITNEDYNLYHLFEKELAQVPSRDNVPNYEPDKQEIPAYEILENAAVSETVKCEAAADSKAEKIIFTISAALLLLLIGFVLYLQIYEPIQIMELLPYEMLTILVAATGAITLFFAVSILGRKRKIRNETEGEEHRRMQAEHKIDEKQEKALAERSYCGETTDFGKDAEPVHRLVRFTKEGVKEFRLYKTPFIIGKKKALADGLLTSSAVSRMHAKIYREGDKYYLMDLNSTNGTSKNGIRLNANESTVLSYNDEVVFGGELFYFR